MLDMSSSLFHHHHHLTQKGLELIAHQTYRTSAYAFAFVHFRGNDDKGVRLEAPDIMRVFSDIVPFG